MLCNHSIPIKDTGIEGFAPMKICILFICLLFTFDVSAVTYYLDASAGNDTYTGTSSAPWKTISKAKSAVNPGDTVLIRSGNYGSVAFLSADKCGTSWTSAITYKADTGANVVFNALTFEWDSTTVPKPRYIELIGININTPSGTLNVGATVWLEDVLYLKLTNIKVKGYYVSPKSAGITLACIQTSTTRSDTSINNLFINGCEVIDALVGVKIGGKIGNNVEIARNHIHHIAGSGISLVNEAGNGNILINGNHIHNQVPVVEDTGNTHGTGISIRSENLTVKNNIIHDYGNTRGIRTYQAVFTNTGYNNMTFENNLVYDTINMYAVEFVDVGNNFTVRNNTFVGHYDGRTGAYWYNTALMAGTAANVTGSSFYMRNNVFVGNLMIGSNLYSPTNHSNNIMYAYYDGTWRTSYPGNIIVQGNSGHSAYFEGSGKFFIGGSTFTYNYLHKLDLNDDFQLAAGSSAIGYANPAYAPATDLLGNARDTAPDAGCYEYGGSPTTPTNQSPVFDSIGNKTVVAGQPLTFTVNASDPDGDSLTYLADRLPTGATFSNKTFNWTPQPAQIGTYIVLFIVSDGSLQNSLTVSITVTPADTDADGLPDNWETLYFGNLAQTAQDDPDADEATNLDEYNNGTDPTVYNPPMELVLYTKFDEAAGIVAKDFSVYSNDANLINSPVWTAGKFGAALSFNGLNSYVNCGNDESLNLTGGLTICAWINPLSFGQSGWGRIVDKGDGAATGYSFFVDQASNALAYVIYGGTLIKSDPNTVKLNQWQHVAIVYDQTLNTVTFYVNGVKSGTVSYATPPSDSAGRPMVIGIRNSDLKRAFDGIIDDVRIYDQALDQTSIQQILTEPASGSNNPPVLDLIGNRTVNEDQNLTINVNATDSEDDSITYSVMNMPTGAAFNSAEQSFSWTPDYNQAGSFTVTFTASDNLGLDTETINITVNNTNRAPVLDELADRTVNEGVSLTFAVNATDPDSDQLSYWTQDLPGNATFINNIFEWTPLYTHAGTHLITFGVSDGQLEDVDTVIITVNNVNTAPVLQAIGNKSVNENSTLAFTISASDAEKDPISYSANNLPAGASFQTGTFSWTPTYTQAGTYNITFTAADAQLEDTETISVTVNNINRAPVLDKLANRTVEEGTSLTFAVHATDPDGDQLSYWAKEVPGNATFINNIFEWTPLPRHVGTHIVIFGVTDGVNSVSQSVTITVTNKNSSPVLNTIADQTTQPSQTLTFTVSASDPDGDAITYSAVGLPAGATFTGGTFTWTPSGTQVGVYNVTFTASDGSLSASQTVKITVEQAKTNLVLDMKFDDSPTDGALDSSGYGNNGFVFSSTAPKQVDGAYEFDGADDSVTVYDSTSLKMNYITLAAWIYPDQYKDDQRIITKEMGTTVPYSSYSMLLGGSGEKKLEFRVAINGVRTMVTSAANIPLATWTHVAATFDGTKVVLYINGQAVKTQALNGQIQNCSNFVTIGYSQFYPRFFDGKIDGVKIYNTALTATQIAQLSAAR